MALALNDHDGVLRVTGTTSTPSSLFTDRRKINHIYWYRPTTAGHILSFLTNSDKDFLQFYAHSANYSQQIPLYGHDVTGLKIDDMDSGTVYIFYRI
jgi:hypothetical protein